MKEKTPKIEERAPVIAVMGHIDHGKSKLLDYIRKSNVVEKEAGGITQHLSAYEVLVKDKKMTFLDTPGHAAFSKMRSRGASAADIAILVVSAEEGVKKQTLEALESIKKAKIPFVVAISKIDKPSADVNKVKSTLAENEVYLEGFGGDVSFVPISSITGEGIPELLELVLLASELEELKGDRNKNAEGVVIEANLDPRRGIAATLVIKDGTLERGQYVATDNSRSPARIIENFLGEQVESISFSSPVRIVGWNDVPKVGATFKTFDSKKESEEYVKEGGKENIKTKVDEVDENTLVVPIIIKADTEGTAEAVREEIEKIEAKNLILKIISSGTGKITEGDLKITGADENTVILGFNVDTERQAMNIAEKQGIKIQTFDIIYKLVEWVEEYVEKKRPRDKVEEKRGEAKILKIFSKGKGEQVIGGEVKEGALSKGEKFRIMRRGEEIGTGKINGLQKEKSDTSSVNKGSQFGARVSYSTEIAEGDRIETFEEVLK